MKIFSDAVDIDGLASCSLLLLKHQEQCPTFQLLNKGERHICYGDDNSVSFANDDIIVADLSMLPDPFENPVVGELFATTIQVAKSFTIFDHHATTKKYEEQIKGLGIKLFWGAKLCTAKLICNELFPNDPYARWLSTIAQGNDFPQDLSATPDILKLGNDLQKIITLYNSNNGDGDGFCPLRDLVLTLRESGWCPNWYKGDYTLNQGMAHDLHCYENLVSAEKYKAVANQELFQIGQFTFVIANAHPLLMDKQVVRALRDRYIENIIIDAYILISSEEVKICITQNSAFDGKNFSKGRFPAFRGGGRLDDVCGITLKTLITKDTLIKYLTEFIG
ncbi:hypothetical protein A3G56_01635 [Candidatus Falkowbacteria bacterium RIFCSPLOWO2_12_FULL_45_10]|uniref:DHHA1 domain-containing protein n=3 Tax=Candidatus Falkowiibacteriota TaxID=1752728 RepID=A0A1F5RKA9_9BACT|nr:MAG: hypothetical protein A3D54_01525 [Candidatus Falkowbacteria bacterium RIFCSPHIGHO2_02_FULL_45_15]OGF19571.1 MAG: hypothetical protein A3I35_01860 [Candidatus Falkowbacteria bacterium RIFCSPLOWO2_02_FULL_45_15]OGF19797.1 MAG: hypothetical protein A3G56_01635 [Candidatus Falkowbacteria bacterium RIFCSPLOWO2_12_FULL_45_10]